MKRMLFAAILALSFSAAAFSTGIVAEGKSNSALGDYKIEIASNPLTINGQEFKAFVISYQNSPLEVKVAIKKEGNQKKYIVLSDKLSVQYVCNEVYFGVQKLDKSYEKDGYSTSDEVLNRSEYFHQKAITTGQGCDLDNTSLIAAFFPRLINENSDNVAAK
jgi:hypothetical protein